MYKSAVLTLTIVSALFSAVTLAQDAPAKEALCKTCHGANGGAPILPVYPKLNGQNKEYLISALKAYKSGERKGGMAMIMTGQAAQLSDADIEALAAFYAAQK